MTDRTRRVDELAGLAMQAPWLAPTVEASMARARQDNLHQLGDDIMSLHNLHRRLDRIDGNRDELHGLVESLERPGREPEARQAAWTAAGHAGTPPGRQFLAVAPNASHRGHQLWRQIAHGHARVMFGTPGCPFSTLQEAYALDDDALLAAINSHPRYAGWADYDNEPAKGMPS
jgi:hypothetical protein